MFQNLSNEQSGTSAKAFHLTVLSAVEHRTCKRYQKPYQHHSKSHLKHFQLINISFEFFFNILADVNIAGQYIWKVMKNMNKWNMFYHVLILRSTLILIRVLKKAKGASWSILPCTRSWGHIRDPVHVLKISVSLNVQYFLWASFLSNISDWEMFSYICFKFSWRQNFIQHLNDNIYDISSLLFYDY